MYNRYIRNQQGSFTRIPESNSDTGTIPCGPPPPSCEAEPPQPSDGTLLRRILEKLGIGRVDTGDLLLLLILFLLFSEGGDKDEELLIALGLLLIL